jgi:hypothetical protein
MCGSQIPVNSNISCPFIVQGKVLHMVPDDHSRWPDTKCVVQIVRCYNVGTKGEVIQCRYNSE